LNCGNVSKDRESFVLKVSKFHDIVNKIIPFYQENKVVGVKEKDFADLIKVAELMKNKKHLTLEGLDEIR